MFNTLFAFISLFFTGPVEFAATVNVDVQKSEIAWIGTNVVGKIHTGTLKISNGSLEMNGDQLTGGTFVIDMTTLDNNNQTGKWKTKLEGHLKSADFFDVEKYPTASLQIVKVTAKGDGKFDVTGDLTIKGKTESINFEAQLTKGETSTTAKASITFDRSKFDVRYGSESFFDDLGDKAISNDIVLNVTLSVNK